MNRIATVSTIVLLLTASTLASAAVTPPLVTRSHNRFSVLPLDSDGFIDAPVTDDDLVNTWGLALNPAGLFWLANNGTDTATIYTGDGVAQTLVVPLPAGAAPTGVTFYSGNNFILDDGTSAGPARFIFAGEEGEIFGWGPAISPPGQPASVVRAVDSSSGGAVYKGIALAITGSGERLYATDFRNRRVDVFDGAFEPVSLAPAAFVDPHVPAGFAPFGIASIRGRILVTFAKRDATGEDDIAGPGLGFVSVFDTDGSFIARIGTRGPLNAPWGMAIAPAGFGRFGGDLLVGNFGDGRIIAYRIADDLRSAFPEGLLRKSDGRPIVIDGLWAINFGNGAAAAPLRTLFFTAGPGDEQHGLFGRIESR